MALSIKQEDVILDAVDTTAPVILSNGSVSSGKTWSTNHAWAAYITTAPPGHLAVIGKTLQAITRNVIDPMRDEYPPGSIVHTRGADTAVMFGRLVHVLGANDAKAEDKIRGITLAGAYVDEATLLPKGYWDMLLTRLRVPGAKLFATTNPDHPRHPLKLEVIDKAGDLGYVVHHFTMDDNPSLDPTYVARMKASFVGLFYQRFILGLWVAATGAIYDMLDLGNKAEPGPHRIARDNVTLEPERARFGADYGTANATHGVVLIRGRRRSDGREGLVVAGEWHYSGRDTGRSLTDAEQSADIRTWLDTGGTDPGRGKTGQPVSAWSTVRRDVVEAGALAPERWAIDPSAASFKTQLRRDGVSGVRDADNHVIDGLRTVGSLIAADRLWFLEGACPVLEGQLLGYVWDDDPGVDAPASGQEDHGCLIAGTLVATEAGPVPIQDVRPGDRVWTRDGLREVLEAGMTSADAPIVTAHLADGSTLTGTGNHPVWTGDDWTDLTDTAYRNVSVWPTGSRTEASRSAATPTPQDGPSAPTTHPTAQHASAAYDASTKRSTATTTANPRPAGTSTTPTTTTSTTTRPTSSPSTLPHTKSITPPNAEASAPRRRRPRSRRPAWLPLPGTGRRKAGPGTPSTAATYGPDASPSSTSASDAERRTTPRRSTVQTGSAPTAASPRPDARLVSTTRTEPARSAPASSASTGTARPELVPVRVLAVRRAGRAPVFNLKVDGSPEFFADGVLVHNCDGFRYAVMSARADWRPWLTTRETPDAGEVLPTHRVERMAQVRRRAAGLS